MLLITGLCKQAQQKVTGQIWRQKLCQVVETKLEKLSQFIRRELPQFKAKAVKKVIDNIAVSDPERGKEIYFPSQK